MTSIPRHAEMPSGTLFPFRLVTEDELAEEMSTEYTLLRAENKVTIRFKDGPLPGDQGTYATVPLPYEALVRRFLYRGNVLRTVLESKGSQTKLNDDIKESIRANLLHFFRVLEECRTLFNSAAKHQGEVKIPFFDLYMIQENFVGRHDPAAVIDWQREHPDCNLRTQNVFTLGEFVSPCIARR